MSEPVGNLSSFTVWGGKQWEQLVSLGIKELQREGDLSDSHLLEIGTRYGKMAFLFAQMGARVTGIDIQEQYLHVAQEEAQKEKISNVHFITYDGDLDIFADESFDVIFTKSVLVRIPNLEQFLKKLAKKLKTGGKVFFVENGRGNFLFHILRKQMHSRRNLQRLSYFTDKEMQLVQSVFQTDTMKKTVFPPVYLFVGQKRA